MRTCYLMSSLNTSTAGTTQGEAAASGAASGTVQTQSIAPLPASEALTPRGDEPPPPQASTAVLFSGTQRPSPVVFLEENSMVIMESGTRTGITPGYAASSLLLGKCELGSLQRSLSRC